MPDLPHVSLWLHSYPLWQTLRSKMWVYAVNANTEHLYISKIIFP